jgi:AraC-like DNA-binding protein
MLLFSPTRVFFLVFGIVFACFSVLFLLSRTKQSEWTLFAAFFGHFGGFFILLALWDILAAFRLYTHVASLVLGLPLVPISLAILGKMFGETEGLRRWLVPCVLGSFVVFLICAGMFIGGMGRLWPLALSRGWAFVCFAFTISVEVYRLRPFDRLPRQLLQFFIFLAIGIMALAVLAVFHFFNPRMSHLLIWMLIAVILCFAASTVYRSPGTFKLLEAQSRGVRSSRSLLRTIDIQAKLDEIGRLLREKRIYRDSELSLLQLATQVQLSPHQLSELLNTYAKQNFSEYVMRYRIEHAKRELADPRGESILDIAFSSGFNAKSTFNSAFRQATGLTPSGYRKAERPKNKTSKKK